MSDEPENACCNDTGRATGPCRNPGCTAVPVSTAPPTETETRYYIALVNTGMRLLMKAGPGQFNSDPHAPIHIKDGSWLYPVSAEIAREWMADDDEDDES